MNEGLRKYSDESGCTTIFVDLWTELPFGILPLNDLRLQNIG